MTEQSSPKRDEECVTITRAALEQLQRLASIGAVGSSVAHEFNNILTSILNQARLGQRTADAALQQRAFDSILSCARRAAKVTTGILALSRNRSARREAHAISDLVDEVLGVLEKDLSKHQIRLHREYRQLPVADVVPAQIEQVLMNLIINARQAMPGGGMLQLLVDYNTETQMAEISISDTGVGIEPEKLSKIFEPFYTTKQGPDETGRGGSGLGLAICREIIERHQGRIRVQSMVGRGTTFTLKIPAQVKAVAAVA